MDKDLERERFISSTLKHEPEADRQVLGFIYNFTWSQAKDYDQFELVRLMFMAGYCWHFAHILKTTFERGEVCWCAPFGHFVWVDTNGVPYDAEGVSSSEAAYYIPEHYVGEGLKDFRHIPGVSFGASQEYINGIIDRYLRDTEGQSNSAVAPLSFS